MFWGDIGKKRKPWTKGGKSHALPLAAITACPLWLLNSEVVPSSFAFISFPVVAARGKSHAVAAADRLVL